MDQNDDAVVPSQPEALALPAKQLQPSHLTPSKANVLRGGLWSGGSQIAQIFLGLPLTVLLVRIMAPSEYGTLALAFTTMSFLSVVGGLGLSAGVSRVAAYEYATHGLDGVLGVYRIGRKLALAVGAISAVGCCLLAALSQHLHSLRGITVPLLILVPVIGLAASRNVLVGVLRAIQQPRKAEIPSSIGAVVTLIATGVVVAVGFRTVIPITVARAVGLLTPLAFLMAATHWMSSRPKHATTVHVPAKSILSFSFPLFLNSVVLSAIAQLDVLLLGYFHGPKLVALYAPINRLAAWPTTVFAFVGAYLLPQLTQAVALKDHHTFASLYHAASRWGWIVAIPFVAPLLAAPSSVLSILFGSHYASLSAPTRVLTIAALFSVLPGFNAAAVDAHGNPKRIAIRSAVALAVGVGACFGLVPIFGIMGAAWATVIGMGTLNALNSALLAVQYRVWPWDRALTLIFAAVAAAVAAAYFVAPAVPSSFGRCIVTAAMPTVVAIVVLVAVVDDEERHLLVGRVPWLGSRLSHR